MSHFLPTLAFALSSFLFASEDAKWVWLNPLPQSNTLLSAAFTNVDTGYVVGTQGTILKTTDGGTNWIVKIIDSTTQFSDVQFWNSRIGIAVGYQANYSGDADVGVAYKTEDGGQNWKKLNPGANLWLRVAQFVDEKNFFVAGKGILSKTSDGGTTWNVISRDSTADFTSISFLTKNVGFACRHVDDRRSRLYRTEDGGSTWDSVSFQEKKAPELIYFIDARRGFVSVYEDSLGRFFRKTDDGGITWSNINLPPGAEGWINRIQFLNDSIGYAFSSIFTQILKTKDGGTNWTLVKPPSSKETLRYWFVNEKIGYGVGGFGSITKSSDGGLTWISLKKNLLPAPSILNSVFFTDVNTGYAAGIQITYDAMVQLQGLICKTSDGGRHWSVMLTGTRDYLNSIHFLDSELGIAASQSGRILRTKNHGSSWEVLETGNRDDLRCVQAVSGLVAYAAGLNGAVIKTVDGGDNWQRVHSDSAQNLYAIHFFTSDSGIAAGQVIINKNILGMETEKGIILQTFNGGKTWRTLEQEQWYVFSLSFPQPNLGFYGNERGEVYFSKDRGSLWSKIASIESGRIQTMQFLNRDTGFVVSSSTAYTRIAATTNGGATWKNQDILESSQINSLHFPEGSVGYAVGDGGIMLKLNRDPGSPIAQRPIRMGNLVLGSDGAFHYRISKRSPVSVQLYQSDGKKILTVV